MYRNTAKASASLLSSPNALINELRAKRLGFKPSALRTLNAFNASSDKPCQKLEFKAINAFFFFFFLISNKKFIKKEANIYKGTIQGVHSQLHPNRTKVKKI
jgi:hypothetical protein